MLGLFLEGYKIKVVDFSNDRMVVVSFHNDKEFSVEKENRNAIEIKIIENENIQRDGYAMISLIRETVSAAKIALEGKLQEHYTLIKNDDFIFNAYQLKNIDNTMKKYSNIVEERNIEKFYLRNAGKNSYEFYPHIFPEKEECI